MTIWEECDLNFKRHTPKKRFGQHWLIDEGVLNQITMAANLKVDDCVLEVGPGRGALTAKLIGSEAGFIHAIELDRDLIVGLQDKFKNNPKLILQQGDVLSIPLQSTTVPSSNKVVANIPYNITGSLLQKLLGTLVNPLDIPYELLVLLLQKEVADRILAKPGQSCFSSLSVKVQLMASCESVCEVAPRCFQPPPKVNSKVIVLKPFKPEKYLNPLIASRLDLLIRTTFIARRKMLRNSLRALMPSSELILWAEKSGIELNRRPQELSIENWLSMAANLDCCEDSI